MAWQESHKQQTREKILHSAAALFTQHGFTQIGINDVMEHCGLTRGAFYAHFTSKADLYAEAVIHAGKLASAQLLNAGQEFNHFVKGYLDESHLRPEGFHCPLACLITDVAHADKTVKKTYTRLFSGFVDHVKKLDSDKTDEEAIANVVMMVGALAIARTMTDERLAKRVINACVEKLTRENELI